MDLEENFQLWRFRHLKMVERTIGLKRGTGGTGGVAFLRSVLETHLLPGAVRRAHGDRNVTAAPLDFAARAAELDAADPLAPLRERFLPSAGVVAYLDGNSLGRPLATAATELDRFVRHDWGGGLIRGWTGDAPGGPGPAGPWMEWPERVGDRIAAVALGAAAGQTVVADSTTVLLYKLARAAVDAAQSRPPRDRLRRVRLPHRPVRAGGHRRRARVCAAPALGRPGRGSHARAGRLRRRPGHRPRVAEPRLLPVRMARRRGCDHACRSRRRRAHALGPQPLRRIRAVAARRVGGRPRSRLHLQVPVRRAGIPRVRLRPPGAAGRAAPAGAGLDGQARPVRNGAGLRPGPRGAVRRQRDAADPRDGARSRPRWSCSRRPGWRRCGPSRPR